MVYTTSLQAVRETSAACSEMLRVLRATRVVFEERDIHLDKKFATELAARLPGAKPPQAFLNGQHFGVISNEAVALLI